MNVLSVSCMMINIVESACNVQASKAFERHEMGSSMGKQRRPIGGFFIVGVSLALLFGVALLKARVR
jgi:hypothetical protein